MSADLGIGGMIALFLAITALVTAMLWRFSQSPKYADFDWIDLIRSRNGFIDQDKLHLEGAFLVSTYGFLWLLWTDKMTEWYFGGYMAAWALKHLVVQKSKVAPEK